MRCFGPTYLSDSTSGSFWLDSAVPRRTEPTCHRPTPTASMTATSWACVFSRANTTSASTAGSGHEYLTTGELRVRRREDVPHLLAIKRGEVALADVQAEAEE